MTYEEQITEIEKNISTRFNWEEAKDRSNHKLYPFYYFQGFHDVKEDTPSCDYCGKSLSMNGNGLYYTAYVLFLNPNTVKLCCNVHHCCQLDMLEYSEQIYGHRKPMELGKFHGSLVHELVFKYILSRTKKFKAWNYTNGFPEKELSFHEWSGGTLELSMYRGQWQMKDKHIEYYKFGDAKKNIVTKAQCLKALNDIIYHNLEQHGAVEGQQLTLF